MWAFVTITQPASSLSEDVPESSIVFGSAMLNLIGLSENQALQHTSDIHYWAILDEHEKNGSSLKVLLSAISGTCLPFGDFL